MLLEGTNDSAAQVSQVEQLIAEDPDVLIILPHEGEPLTPVALEAMEPGIPVVNVDREFSTEGAYRTWIGGDNYGIGVSAANYIAEQLDCQGNVVEIQGLAGISVTEQRTAGFADTHRAAVRRRHPDRRPAAGRLPARQGPRGHGDDPPGRARDRRRLHPRRRHGQGVVSAIENAGREDEMILTGAGGSRAAMERIQEGGLYAATFLYNPSMSASAVRVARLIALGEGFEELVEPEVPSRIELPATTVTRTTSTSSSTWASERMHGARPRSRPCRGGGGRRRPPPPRDGQAGDGHAGRDALAGDGQAGRAGSPTAAMTSAKRWSVSGGAKSANQT